MVQQWHVRRFAAVGMSKKLAAAEASLDTQRDAGRWEEVARAIKTLEKQTEGQVSASHPTPALTLAYRLTVGGELAAHRGRFEEARRLFLRALAAAPGYVDALVSLALLHVEWGSWLSGPESQSGGAPRRRQPNRLPELSRLVKKWRRGGAGGAAGPLAAAESPEATGDAVAAALGFADNDVVELLTRARAAPVEGAEHATPYRLLLRCCGLLLLCKLHERGHVARGLADASDAAPPPANDRCFLSALACCDEAWRLVAHYARARFGVGRGSGMAPSPANDAAGISNPPLRVSSTVFYTAPPAGGAAPRVTSAFLVSSEVCGVADQAALVVDAAAGGIPAHASTTVWLTATALPQPAGAAGPGLGAAPPTASRGRAADNVLLPSELAGARGGVGGIAGGGESATLAPPVSGGPELLICIEPRCREVVAECLARVPFLVHRLGDLAMARRAYIACLDWRGPVAQVCPGAARDALVGGLFDLLCEGSGAAGGVLLRCGDTAVGSSPASSPAEQLLDCAASVLRGPHWLSSSLPPWAWCVQSPPRSLVSTAAAAAASREPLDVWAAADRGLLGDATLLLAALWRFGHAESLGSAPISPLATFLCARRVVEASQLVLASRPRLRGAWASLALGLGAQALLCSGGAAVSADRVGSEAPPAACLTADVVRARSAAAASALFAAVEEVVSLRHGRGRADANARRRVLAQRPLDAVGGAGGEAVATPPNAQAADAAPPASASAPPPPVPASPSAARAPDAASPGGSSAAPVLTGRTQAGDAAGDASAAPAPLSGPKVDDDDDEDDGAQADDQPSPSASGSQLPGGLHVPDSVLLLLASRVALVCANSPGVAVSYAVRAVAACGRNAGGVSAALPPPSELSSGESGSATSAACYATRREARHLLGGWLAGHVASCYEALALSLLSSSRGALAASWGASFAGESPSAGLGAPAAATAARIPGVAARVVVRAVASLRRGIDALVASSHRNTRSANPAAAVPSADSTGVATVADSAEAAPSPSSASLVSALPGATLSSSAVSADPGSADGALPVEAPVVALRALSDADNDGDGDDDDGGDKEGEDDNDDDRGSSTTDEDGGGGLSTDGDDSDTSLGSSQGRASDSGGSTASAQAETAAAATAAGLNAESEAVSQLLDTSETAGVDEGDAMAEARAAATASALASFDSPLMQHWPLLYHSAVALLTLGDAPGALAFARHALSASLSLQRRLGSGSGAPGTAAMPSGASDLPWAAAVLALSQCAGLGTAAALLAGGLRAHPRSALLRLAEARVAELLLSGEFSLGEDSSDDGGVSAGPRSAAAATAGWPAMACSGDDDAGSSSDTLLRLYEDAASLADAEAWAFIAAGAGAAGGDAFAAQSLVLGSGGGSGSASSGDAPPAASFAPSITADVGGLRDALPAPAPPAPAAVRLAVAAHCHVVRVSCALLGGGGGVAGAAALAAADALVDATVLPLRAVYRRQQLQQAQPPRAAAAGGGGAGAGTATGSGAPLAARALPPGSVSAAWQQQGGFGEPPLSSAQREGMPADPALRAEVIHAAGLLREAAGEPLAAQALYAAAAAVAPSHAPSLLRLAELLLSGLPPPAAAPGPASAALAPPGSRDEALDRAEALVDAATRAAPGHFHCLAVRAALANLRSRPDEAVDAALGALRRRTVAALLPAELLPLRTPLWL